MNYSEYIESRQFQADCFEWVRECEGCYTDDIEDIEEIMEGWLIETYQKYINREYDGGLKQFATDNLEFHNR